MGDWTRDGAGEGVSCGLGVRSSELVCDETRLMDLEQVRED